MSLQEKFQVSIPPKYDPEENKEWADFKSARTTGDAGFRHSNNSYADTDVTTRTNFLPPGMEINNQARARIENMPLVMSGQTDISEDTNPVAFEKGYTRKNMKGTDDQYTGEHQDFFYETIVDELGNEGFVERSNYLDRE